MGRMLPPRPFKRKEPSSCAELEIDKSSAMTYDYAQCERSIMAATPNTFNSLDPFIIEAFQKSSTAMVLAVTWYMNNPLSGPNAIINATTQDILKSMIDYDVSKFEPPILDDINPLEEFVVTSPTSAVLRCFCNEYTLTVAYADEGLLNLVNLVVNCDKLIKSYAKKVNNTTAYALYFGYSDAVFQAMKYALTNALNEGLSEGSDTTGKAELDTLRIAAEKGMVALEEQHAAIKAGTDIPEVPDEGKGEGQEEPSKGKGKGQEDPDEGKGKEDEGKGKGEDPDKAKQDYDMDEKDARAMMAAACQTGGRPVGEVRERGMAAFARIAKAANEQEQRELGML
jgi:hypothetical protein